MSYKLLYIIVEGKYDKTFFKQIFNMIFKNKYNSYKLISYAQKDYAYRKKLIKSIDAIDCADYIYIADINSTPCITAKKQAIKEAVNNIDETKILVVIREIESWYLAGLSNENNLKLNIPGNVTFNNTENLQKDYFLHLFKKTRYTSELDFRKEILKLFDVEVAKEKNKSFKYFIEKYS